MLLAWGHFSTCCAAAARLRRHNRGKNVKGLTRFGLPKGARAIYTADLYHTLLNMPRYRFLTSFFCVYLLLVSGLCRAWGGRFCCSCMLGCLGRRMAQCACCAAQACSRGRTLKSSVEALYIGCNSTIAHAVH